MRSFVIALALLGCTPCLAEPLTGHATVVDGDTLDLHGTRVHLYGIDAPEAAQRCETATGQSYPCGHEATRLLRKRIGEGPVTCEPQKEDAKGRLTATCKVGSDDLSAWLVSQGYALASRSVTGAYVRQEARAWATRKGIWAGTFEPPSDWRHDRRRMEATAGTGPDTH